MHALDRDVDFVQRNAKTRVGDRGDGIRQGETEANLELDRLGCQVDRGVADAGYGRERRLDRVHAARAVHPADRDPESPDRLADKDDIL